MLTVDESVDIWRQVDLRTPILLTPFVCELGCLSKEEEDMILEQ